MRRIDVLRILALSSALILALGGACGTNEEDTSDTSEPPGIGVFPPVEVSPPDEAPRKYVEPHPGVDWDALGPVGTQMEPSPATLE